MICPIRDFLAESVKDEKILVGRMVFNRYFGFLNWLETSYYKENDLNRADISFGKFSQLISEFLAEE